jgi:hypothetical protein
MPFRMHRLIKNKNQKNQRNELDKIPGGRRRDGMGRTFSVFHERRK